MLGIQLDHVVKDSIKIVFIIAQNNEPTNLVQLDDAAMLMMRDYYGKVLTMSEIDGSTHKVKKWYERYFVDSVVATDTHTAHSCQSLSNIQKCLKPSSQYQSAMLPVNIPFTALMCLKNWTSVSMTEERLNGLVPLVHQGISNIFSTFKNIYEWKVKSLKSITEYVYSLLLLL